MNIIGRRKIWFIFSGTLIIASVVALALWGLRTGIDFQGGSLLEISFGKNIPNTAEINKIFEDLEIARPLVQSSGVSDIVLRFAPVDENMHRAIVDKFVEQYGQAEETRFDSIGPAIGQELYKKSVTSVIIVMLVIMAYIGWSFRKVSKPVPAWVYGVVVITSFIHDVIIPLGVFAWLGHFYNVEIGSPFIAAILMILGYSINDTIVVLDRVRENLRKVKGTLVEVLEASVHQTISRSINTSFTVLLTLVAVLIFGGSTLATFSIALIIGVVFGTYSSIFIAVPLLVTWYNLKSRK